MTERGHDWYMFPAASSWRIHFEPCLKVTTCRNVSEQHGRIVVPKLLGGVVYAAMPPGRGQNSSTRVDRRLPRTLCVPYTTLPLCGNPDNAVAVHEVYVSW